MCKWGTEERVWVTIPADLSHTGEPFLKFVGIDKCIAPLVRTLEQGGFKMRGSCCGHYKTEGYIHFQNGWVLVINYKGNEYMRNLKAFNEK